MFFRKNSYYGIKTLFLPDIIYDSMRFVDREYEILRLKHVLGKDGHAKFVIVYGRRRLGKSTLIRHVIDDQDVYFMADQTEQSQQLALMAKTIGTRFPDFDKVFYPDWDSLFSSLAHRAKERFTLCIDEFPYLVKSCPSLPSVLQRHIDSHQLPFNLIICGSSQQMMQGFVLDAASPLYGRADAILKLEPIPVRFLQEILGCDAIQTIEESAVWGGVPRYWEIREQSSSLTEAITQHIIDPNGILYDEPSRLFIDDFQHTTQSAALLSLIGNGVNRLSEIAGRMQKNATDLSGPLAKLINLGYIERETPFGESPRNSKRSYYQICDPFMRMYYRYVVPNRSLINLRRHNIVAQTISDTFSDFVALHWERLCRNAVSGNRLLDSTWGMASRWWGTVIENNEKKTIELDVVAESTDKRKMLIGECKWTEGENAMLLFRELETKAKSLPFVKGKEIVLALFLKHPSLDGTTSQVFLPQDVVNDFQ